MPVNIIDTLKPKNGGNFPIVEAIDVFVENYGNLAEAVSHFATDVMIEAINTVLSGKANISDITNLQNQINQIEISASAEAVVAPEVAAARVDAEGITHTTLKARIDSTETTTKEKSNLINNISYARSYGVPVGLSIAGFDFYARGTMNSDGSINESGTSSHAIFKLAVQGLKSFKVVSSTIPSASLNFCAFYNSSGTVIPYSVITMSTSSATTNVTVLDTVPDDGYMLIVWWNYYNTPNAYYNSISDAEYKDINTSLIENVIEPLEEDIQENAANISQVNAQINKQLVIKNFSSMTFYANGFVTNTGVLFVSQTSSSHAIYMMPVGNIKRIAFKSAQEMISTVGFGAIYTAGGQFKQTFTADGTTAEQQYTINADPTDIIYVSWYNYQSDPTSYFNSCKIDGYPYITDIYHEEIAEIVNETVGGTFNYFHCVKKPIAFNEKKLQFFGDSITYGYIRGSAYKAENNYPKVFSQSVGAAAHRNDAVSGSTLAVVSGYDSIYTKIQSDLDSTYDVVFVAGGINDWQIGVDAATLKSAVKDICDYLTENFTGKVIFITPINEAGRVPIETPAQSVDSVRKIITETALTYGYSVVQGWQFPFPSENEDSDYIDAMFQDKLHPTELGYSMYAQALQNAVC